MEDTIAADKLKETLDLNSGVGELEAELNERKHVEVQLHSLTGDLEQRLKESKAELAAAKGQLKVELSRRADDRREIELLKETLRQQQNAYAILDEELGSFCYAISHDLRAPLRHILGFSDALSEDSAQSLDDSGKSYLNCIVRAGRKMDAMLEALLNLSRLAKQDLHRTEVDLSRLARNCAASLHDSAPERRVLFHIQDNLKAHVDAVLLKVVIDNLLENAWKFTGEKDVATIEFSAEKQGDAEVFYLRDNGAGFDMRYADRLFAPFQRMHAESEFEGRGMGLATVQRIIHRHGGRIWAEATLKGGATIYFTLSDAGT
jgi:light-regulated signal transduction histidine kinase (bacteriophytochrome)